jgi:tetratricopeptide (TPR) repeat protein
MVPFPPSLSSQPDRRREWWLAALLAIVAGIAYLPMLHNGFVWDDDTFLTKNPLIKAPDGLFRFWFSTQPSDYWPVTSSTLWVEWRLWGMHAVGYHATNLLLHITEGLMLWSILRRLRVPGAYLAALLFVVHPVNVESVAWIAQRKNLMAMLFYLLSIHCFLRTRWSDPTPGRLLDSVAGPAPRSRVAPPGDLVMYGLSLLAFILALLSKGSVAPLPVVFLGIIAWRRQATSRDILKLAPFFLVAVVLIGVNVWFQTHGWTGVIRHANGLQRLLGAGAVVWFYLSKALLPVGLVFVYPQWVVSAGNPLWWLPLLAAIGLTALLWTRLRSLSPVTPSAARNPPAAADQIPRYARNDRIAKGEIWRGAFFAWLYFGAMLLPVMGFTDVYFMRYSLVADHYQHLAIIGVLALAAAAWAQWAGEPRLKLALAAGAVAALAVLTWRQCGMYRDTATLYRVTLEKNPDCWMVYNNQGLLETAAGQPEKARQDFDRALQLNPHFYEASVSVGNSDLAQGRPQEALAHYAQALRDNPDYPEGYYSLGRALQSVGQTAEAIPAYERALRLRPDYPDAENNLGIALADSGRISDAVIHYQKAMQLDPAYPEAPYNLGNALHQGGREDEAIQEYEAALRLRPDYPDAERNLGVALERAGRPAEAAAHFENAFRLHPDNFEAHNNLGIALATMGHLAEAEAQFQTALQIKPDYASAQQNLARVKAMER